MERISSHTYDVVIGNESLQELNNMLLERKYSQAFIIVDENTIKDCLPEFLIQVGALKDAEIIETESGEINKNIDVVTQVWFAMSELHADRKSVVLNLGGGVIGDMGGFIASTYKRGVDFINVPTTLLSQVDSSVGGKLGIDLGGLKNQIGVFNFPQAVFIYPKFLETLEYRQLRSGYAEVMKHALIKDANHWNLIKTKNPSDKQDWQAIIAHSVQIKNNVVLNDPKEKGERKILNFGHTVGHAIETYHLEHFDDFFLHGEAIAIGMVVEAILSGKYSELAPEEIDDIAKSFARVFELKPLNQECFDNYIGLMAHDKKNQNGKVSFSLLKHIGECTWDSYCSDKDVISALNTYNDMIGKL